jgi:hypothetical protein
MLARARRSAHDAAIQDLALLHEVAPEAGWFVTTTISRGSSLVPQTSQFENSGNKFVVRSAAIYREERLIGPLSEG